MKKKQLNLSRLEKLPDEELLKLNKEYNEKIIDNKKFINNFDLYFEEFKTSYYLLEKKVKEINIFFKSNFKVDKTETGIFSKSVERHLIFSQNTKINYENKLDEIIKIYDSLIEKNYKFPFLPSVLEKIDYISDDIFKCNRHRNNNKLHLFNFEIETLEDETGRSAGYGCDIFSFEALSGYKSLSFNLNVPTSGRSFPKAIAEKSIYQEYIDNLNSDYEKILRKIELTLRSIKKGKEKTENVGYVYILSNNAYPNIYKIGSTYGLPEERAEELTGTGHLLPFKVEDKIKIKSAEFYEKKIHSLLNKYRVKQNREFFQMELSEIKKILKQVSALTERGERKLSLTDLEKKIK